MTVPADVFSCCCDWGFEFSGSIVNTIFTIRGANVEVRNKHDLSLIRSINWNTAGIDSDYWSPPFFTSMDRFYNLWYEGVFDGQVKFASINLTPAIIYDNLDYTLEIDLEVSGYIAGQQGFELHWRPIADDESAAIFNYRTVYAPSVSGGNNVADTKKFDSSGNLLWEVRESFPSSISATPATGSTHGFGAKGIVGFNDGSVHSFGLLTDELGKLGTAHYRYDTDGNKLWEEINHVSGDDYRIPDKAVFLENGTLVVAYRPNDLTLTPDDTHILKGFDSAGNVLFDLDDLDGSSELVDALVSHGDSIIIIRGDTSSGFRLEKFSGATFGTLDWSVSIPASVLLIGIPTSSIVMLTQLAVDQEGNIYACRFSDGAGKVRKYKRSDGSLLATATAASTLEYVHIPPGPPPNYHY